MMPSEMRDRAFSHLRVSAETKGHVAERCADAIVEAAGAMANSLRAGGKVLLCGNGGSAADCQHFAAELMSTLTKDFLRPGLRAIALTTDTSLLTAYTNDFGFEGVFARQVATLGDAGDVLIGISTSGNSRNVILAMETARKGGLRTIALLGEGGRLQSLAEVVIAVPSTSTQHIQESHIAIAHILCDLVERVLYEKA